MLGAAGKLLADTGPGPVPVADAAVESDGELLLPRSDECVDPPPGLGDGFAVLFDPSGVVGVDFSSLVLRDDKTQRKKHNLSTVLAEKLLSIRRLVLPMTMNDEKKTLNHTQIDFTIFFIREIEHALFSFFLGLKLFH